MSKYEIQLLVGLFDIYLFEVLVSASGNIDICYQAYYFHSFWTKDF